MLETILFFWWQGWYELWIIRVPGASWVGCVEFSRVVISVGSATKAKVFIHATSTSSLYGEVKHYRLSVLLHHLFKVILVYVSKGEVPYGRTAANIAVVTDGDIALTKVSGAIGGANFAPVVTEFLGSVFISPSDVGHAGL